MVSLLDHLCHQIIFVKIYYKYDHPDSTRDTLYLTINKPTHIHQDWSQIIAGWCYAVTMMTSSNGNIFRVTVPLCGEFTGHRWIPLTKASDAELWCFLWSGHWINICVNNRETDDLRRHRAHYDVIVMAAFIWHKREWECIISVTEITWPPFCSFTFFNKNFRISIRISLKFLFKRGIGIILSMV